MLLHFDLLEIVSFDLCREGYVLQLILLENICKLKLQEYILVYVHLRIWELCSCLDIIILDVTFCMLHLNDVQIGWEIKTRTVEEWKRALFSYYVVTRCKKKDSLLPIHKCLQRFLDICFKITVERLCFAIHIFRLVASNTREMVEVDIYFIPDSSREILLYVV